MHSVFRLMASVTSFCNIEELLQFLISQNNNSALGSTLAHTEVHCVIAKRSTHFTELRGDLIFFQFLG
jgi:hypothetical protein